MLNVEQSEIPLCGEVKSRPSGLNVERSEIPDLSGEIARPDLSGKFRHAGKNPKSKKIKVGLIQMSMTSNPNDNLKKAKSFVEKAVKRGATVICLPEMFKSQYFCQKEDHKFFKLAEPMLGESVEAFQKISKKNKSVIIVPIFERRAAGIYHNSLVVIDANGKVAGTYRKMHIPDDPAYYEKFYFTPGDLGFKSFKTKYGNIGTLICWDQWYPEAARLTALQGADILFYPTAIGWHPSEKEKYGTKQRESWITVQRGHAVANGIYIAAANRVGYEKLDKESDGIEFWGSSFICDPQGEVIAQASSDQEEILYAEINLSYVESVRQHWPFLRDRRVDAYGDIVKRFID